MNYPTFDIPQYVNITLLSEQVKNMLLLYENRLVLSKFLCVNCESLEFNELRFVVSRALGACDEEPHTVSLEDYMMIQSYSFEEAIAIRIQWLKKLSNLLSET